MNFKEKINKSFLPRHIAIVMDGNGRWAKYKGFDRLFGHSNGIKTVRQITEAAVEIGLEYLTLYTFSTENWNRPEKEIAGIMRLLVESIEKETPTFHQNNVRLLVIGDLYRLQDDVRAKLQGCITETSKNTGLSLVLALSYSSKWEIIKAFKDIIFDLKNGKFDEDFIDERLISEYLTTRNIPDPDMLIRTGGEVRISNFLLWQAAYSELFFTDVFWPDFTKENFYEMIVEYQNRERRFGKTSEQVSIKN
ncbi:MAG: isoprenyl transferase [Prevotellaceae bacterium]|jgi:undecaprenyl diphosphate synthase|nr:isoprenyl transferase [Prevotellaceae bacterium]